MRRFGSIYSFNTNNVSAIRNVCNVRNVRNYSIFSAFQQGKMEEMSRLDEWKNKQVEELTKKGTQQAIQLLKTVDEELGKENIDTTVGFNAGIFFISFTKKANDNESLRREQRGEDVAVS